MFMVKPSSKEPFFSKMRHKLGSIEETRLISLVIGLSLVLGVLGIYVSPLISSTDRSGDYIEYSAVLYKDGTLDETYIYHLTGNVETRMLYRFWDMEMSTSTLMRPQIILLGVYAPAGSISYIKDYRGEVTILSSNASPNDKWTISSLAYENEAGCFNPNYFTAGTHEIRFRFKIIPEIESDNQHDHLNLMFAREHLIYKSVTITLKDSSYLSSIYPHPPSLSMMKIGGDTIITGSSAENELLEVEMLAETKNSPWRGYAYVTPEINTKALTEQANNDYNLKYLAATWLNYVSKASVLVVPIIFLVLWIRFGSEVDATVPTYLSGVPHPERRPWLVNLIFKGAIDDFDENGFYSTLLDLHQRKKI
ncbi:DUF2207 domain-containing protein, partial [Candidatus Bathyarchaeota archaeon]|nr:DUF2207 domain-containing protein [Candidatus Bathyarchaeota archaeon]